MKWIPLRLKRARKNWKRAPMVLKSEMISCIVCETERMDITKHIEINHLTGVTQVTFDSLETEQLLTKAEC